MKVSGAPGCFEVGTSGAKTTTIGTWLSESIKTKKYIQTAQKIFGHLYDEPLTTTYQAEETNNIVIMDTEGLNHQTEYGDSYDVVTITPNTLIAENIFLVVVNRANPKEIKDLLNVIANAAQKAFGGFEHRNYRPFNRLTIIINKCQEISLDETEVLREFEDEYPTLIRQLKLFFNEGPNIVALPTLQWDNQYKPDFEADNFFLTFDHIRKAQKDSSEAMMTGLAKISELIIQSSLKDFSLPCDNFEDTMSDLYEITTGEDIDIGDLDYKWSLQKAKNKLHDYVIKFNLDNIGLTDAFIFNVCPRMDTILFRCFETAIQSSCHNSD